MKRIRLFESKKVLIVYIICNALTVLTILADLFSTLIMLRGTLGKLFEHIGLCVIALLFYQLPLFLRMKARMRIPSFLQITVTVFAIAHFVIGEVARAYDHSLTFDKLLHTASGIIFGICGFSLVNGLNSGEKPLYRLTPLFVTIFSFCFALAIGYVWELVEFTIDSVAGINMQRWQDGFTAVVINGEEQLVRYYGRGNGLVDSMGDMIVNMAGAIIISLLGYVWLKTKSKRLDSILITSFERSDNLEEKQNAPQTDSEQLSEAMPAANESGGN